jgi:hemerythrin
MEKMTWEPEYSVGQEYLDEQHKTMIDMINVLIDDPTADYTSEVVADLLAEGTRYAVKHFKSEEDYMESIGYPGLAVHRQEHKQFLVKMANVSMLVMQKKKGPTDLLAYLKTWLMHHILYSDMKYKKFREQIYTSTGA